MTGSGGRKFENPKERARAIRLYHEGASIPKIARTLGFDRRKIAYWVNPPNEAELVRRSKLNKRMHRIGHLYLGRVAACPLCGNPGYVALRWNEHVVTGTRSFFWSVQHNPHQRGDNETKLFHVIPFTKWDGEGIQFTSSMREDQLREQQFRNLVPGGA